VSYQQAIGSPAQVAISITSQGNPTIYQGAGNDPLRALEDALRQYTGKETPMPRITTHPMEDESGIWFAIARVGDNGSSSSGRSRSADQFNAQLQAYLEASLRYHGIIGAQAEPAGATSHSAVRRIPGELYSDLHAV